MPYTLPLARTLRKAGWQVKIYDAEGPEEPHVPIFRRGRKWRFSLRTGEFLDAGEKGQIDADVIAAIENRWQTLKAEWDRIHGAINPISSGETENGN
jgi:hypothetical protein